MEYPNVSVPEVKIAGVALPAQSFVWRFTTGVEPYTTTFVLPDYQSTILESVQNPVNISIKFPTATGIKSNEPSEITISNLYLVSRKHLDLVNVQWTIADSRWLLQGKKIFAAYNKTLPSKSSISVFAGNTGSPSDLKVYWETLSKGRYVWWTVKLGGLPYTMKEIIEKEIEALGLIVRKGDAGLASYIVDNVIMDGTDAVKTIEDFLKMAKEAMSVNLQGQIYIYPVYSYGAQDGTIKRLADSKVAQGCLYYQQKKKGRPKNITVLFEKKVETLVVATEENRSPVNMGYNTRADSRYTTALKPVFDKGLEWLDNADAIANARIIGCVNVVKCPFNLGDEEWIGYNAGEYVAFSKFLAIFRLTELMDLIGKAWFNGGLELRLTAYFKNLWKKPILTTNLQNKVQMICNAIRTHWRRTYQIDPYYLDLMKSWDVRRVSVINSYDGRTAPSPVYANHFYIPFARSKETSEASWKSDSYSWDVAVNDSSLTKPAPAVINIVNSKLGIFEVQYLKPIDPGVSLTGPFSLTAVPLPSPESPSTTLDFCYPAKNHTLITYFSIVWHKDPAFSAKYSLKTSDIMDGLFDANTTSGANLKSQYYAVRIPPPNNDGEFPGWEVTSSADYARMMFVADRKVPSNQELEDIKDEPLRGVILNTLTKDLNAVSLSLSGKPTNEAYLDAIARYEAGRIYNLFNDLIAGSITLPGLLSEIEVAGNLGCITYSLSPQKGATTTYEFIDVMPYAQVESTLPQRYVDYLRGNISRGDDISEVHIAR